MSELRFRQVHLDFHTSPFIPKIGAAFDKKEWQERLLAAHVNSITCFSSCHHGWSYHPTKVGQMHPNLKFNLLRAEIDACHEVDINVPVYLTGGVNNVAAEANPGWREINPNGEICSWARPLAPGFKKLCFNSPYLDYLCRMLEEAVRMFPDGNGIFIDIVSQGQCCCEYCLRDMRKEGYNPLDENDRKRFSRRTLLKYYQRTAEAVRSIDSKMPIFHNSGNVVCGDREILPYFSHLELESLPTGGWGYDHYPISAAYCRNLGVDFLGMTGKFHTTWGEFGGFKHPNALRYECAAMLANGSKCSIGDQLHPSGELDRSTYELIGKAYAEVEEKEPWCGNVKSAATIALLSNIAFNAGTDHAESARTSGSETGAARMMLEKQIPFDILDREMNFGKYKVLILADNLVMTSALKKRLDTFLKKGGKLVISGTSGFLNGTFAFDSVISRYDGANPDFPDYIQGNGKFAPSFVKTPFVMYQPSTRIHAAKGTVSLGKVFDPYFSRTFEHFSSHQHTPYKPQASGYDAGVLTQQILYFAHPVFQLYSAYGNVALKEFVMNAFQTFAADDFAVRTNLPSQGRATLMKQSHEKRYVLHLLYANTISRGGVMQLSGGNVSGSARNVEVIEDLNPVYEVETSVLIPEKVKKVTLEPQGTVIDFKREGERCTIRLDRLVCHQMVVFHY